MASVDPAERPLLHRALMHEARLLVVALQYFTRLPMPALAAFDARWLSQCVRYFPVAGLVVGGLSALVLVGAAQGLPWPLAAALAIAAALAATGAFHEDGLADTFDALGGSVPRERALAIMRDSRIGTYGACALALCLLLRWQVLVALPPAAAVACLLVAHPLARGVAAALMAALPYVRLEDDAKAKPVARGVGPGLAACALGLAMLPAVALAFAWPGLRAAMPAALAAAALAGLACLRWFRRRLGGYTGDALGCAEQLAEVAIGLAFVAVLGGGG
jgi:adenosylcobinamide-GDP ribazoletransferase